MQPLTDLLARRGHALGLAVTTLALAACSHGQRDGAPRDSAPAASPPTSAPSSPSTATVVAAPTPLAHDSVIVAAADTGVRVGADGRLLLPIVFAASCQGEDCESAFTGLACAAVELRSAPDTTAPVVARIAKGDSVDVRRTDLHVLRPGVVVVKQSFVLKSDENGEDNRPMPRKDTLHLSAGDTVYLLRYEMLGSWVFRWKDKTTDGGEFWGGPFGGEAMGGALRDTSRGVARSQPVTEDWWLLHDGSQPMGWWRTDSAGSLRSKRNMDYWGEHCPERGPSTAQ